MKGVIDFWQRWHFPQHRIGPQQAKCEICAGQNCLHHWSFQCQVTQQWHSQSRSRWTQHHLQRLPTSQTQWFSVGFGIFFFLNCPPCSPHCPFSWILLLSRGVPNGKFNWHWEGGRKDSPGRTNRSLQESPALVVQQNLNQWACYQLWANCPFPVFSKCAHPECKTGFGFRSL